MDSTQNGGGTSSSAFSSQTKNWELTMYDLQRMPHEVITDDTEIAVDPVDLKSELTCPICLSILTATMTSKECLHRFCSECIVTALRSGNKECPTCRKKLVSKRSLRRDPNFDELINAIYPHHQDEDDFADSTPMFPLTVNYSNGASPYVPSAAASFPNEGSVSGSRSGRGSAGGISQRRGQTARPPRVRKGASDSAKGGGAGGGGGSSMAMETESETGSSSHYGDGSSNMEACSSSNRHTEYDTVIDSRSSTSGSIQGPASLVALSEGNNTGSSLQDSSKRKTNDKTDRCSSRGRGRLSSQKSTSQSKKGSNSNSKRTGKVRSSISSESSDNEFTSPDSMIELWLKAAQMPDYQHAVSVPMKTRVGHLLQFLQDQISEMPFRLKADSLQLFVNEPIKKSFAQEVSMQEIVKFEWDKSSPLVLYFGD